MNEIIYNISLNMLGVIFITSGAVLFPLSVYKCLGGWNGRNRILSVLLLLVLNPLTAFLAAVIATTAALDWFLFAMIGYPESAIVYYLLCGVSNGIFFLLFGFFAALALAKYFKQEDRFLIYFLFMMYMIMYFTMDNNAERNDFSGDLGWQLLSLAWNMIPVAVVLFNYIQVVLPLSKLREKGVRANKKIFVVPITILVVVFSIITSFYSLSKTDMNVIIEYIYSAMIIFLLMWAFSVIIKNIAATNEAIESKDEAIEAKNEAIEAKNEAIEAKNQIKELSVEVMEALAHTIDAKDEYTRGHSVRVAVYSRMIAERMGLSKDECDDVYYMGLLHDLGKIGVPNEIINSPTKLTDEEYAVIKTHPGVGSLILAEIKCRPDLMTGARWHHEKYGGTGYPDGISGEITKMDKRDFAFDKMNYILLAVGMAVVVLGFLLMSGSGSTETAYDPDIFSARRIKVAPLVCLAGFVSMIYAVIYRSKGEK